MYYIGLIRKLLIGVPFSLFIAPAAHSEWLFNAEAAFEYDDNLPRAQEEQDIESGSYFLLEVSPSHRFQITNYSSLTFTPHLQASKHLDFRGLDQYSVGASTSFFHKFGIGPDVPWLRISPTVSRHNFKNNQRDGWQYALALFGGKKLSSRLEGQIGYTYELFRSDSRINIPSLVSLSGIQGNAFDTDGHTFSIRAIYTVSYRLSLLFEYGRHMGEVSSTTRRNSAIFNASDAIAPDPVFGSDRFVYRIDADTNIFSFGISYALDNNTSLNAGYEYRDSKADQNINYSNSILYFEFAIRY